MKNASLAGVLTCSLLLLMIGTASAYSLGHDTIERSNVDNYINFTMIDLGLQFTDAGRIDSWSFYAQNTGDVYLQTFRLDSGSTYSIVGENFLTANSIGVNTFDIPTASEILYQAGDYIGWTFTDPAVFGHDKVGDDTMYTSDGGIVTDVGNSVSFIGTTSRTYSISADIAPVPEPSTLLLLGSGLAGLGFYARKRKKT